MRSLLLETLKRLTASFPATAKRGEGQREVPHQVSEFSHTKKKINKPLSLLAFAQRAAKSLWCTNLYKQAGAPLVSEALG